MKQVKNWILGVALAVVLTATALAADLQKGKDAFNAGDHATALAEFTPLAEAGDAEAQEWLGWMYANGKGVEQDDAEAVKWYRLAVEGFRRAAEAGDAEAQYNLGVMYGEGRGVAQDDAEAVKWWLLAAEAGDASARYNLGWMYANGKGVEQDDAEAVKWFRRAADASHVRAQYNLGRIYFNGEGVEQNYAEAVKWWRLAAEAGLADAQNGLGVMYENGRGVEQNYGEAIKWYSLAVEQGDARAQENLDILREKVLEALFIIDDYATAHAGLTALAEVGDVAGQHFLGVMYAEGTGVVPNYHLGYMWLALAAAQGHGWGTEVRDNVARRMSPAQVAEAQAMAQKCLAQNYKGC